MPQITIQFLDVGQGDGMYIIFPNGVTMLVDLGSTQGKSTTGPDINKYFLTNTKFKTKGALLNYLIVTHPDGDHYNLINGFLKAVAPTIENYTYGGPSSLYSDSSWMDNVKAAGGKIFSFSKLPAQLQRPGGFGTGVEVWCLAYDTAAITKKSCVGWIKNTNSVVLQIVYNNTKILLTGDATRDTENTILATLKTKKGFKLADLRSEVLKVAHHGSVRTSNCREWLTAVNPEFAFISSDRHGSLDDDLAKSGHRLPQELTLQMIRKYAPRLMTDFKMHPYISSYDPEDYDNFAPKDPTLVDPKLTAKNPFTKKGTGWPRSWYEIKTQEAIFTTLVQMGMGADADQGCQYQLTVTDEGEINVSSTV